MSEQVTNTFNYNYWGFMLAVFSIIFEFVLGVWIWYIDKRRRQNEEVHYKTLVKENLKEIQKIFNEVAIKSQRETHSSEENESIAIQLGHFFNENRIRIYDVIRDTKVYLREWKSLKNKEKTDIKFILECFEWLTNDYYPLDKTPLVQQRRWLENHAELYTKKEQVDTKVKMIITK